LGHSWDAGGLDEAGPSKKPRKNKSAAEKFPEERKTQSGRKKEKRRSGFVSRPKSEKVGGGGHIYRAGLPETCKSSAVGKKKKKTAEARPKTRQTGGWRLSEKDFHWC